MPEPVLNHSNMYCWIFILGRWNFGMVCMRLTLLAKCSELSRRSYKVLILQQQGKNRGRVGKTHFNENASRKKILLSKIPAANSNTYCLFPKKHFYFCVFLIKKKRSFPHMHQHVYLHLFSSILLFFHSPLI